MATIFWDMQQNQELRWDADWKNKMMEIELWVSDMDEYKNIVFFIIWCLRR